MSNLIRLSQRKIANMGAAYTAQFIGLPVVHTTYDGEQLVGTVEEFRSGYPVIRFPDGGWARGGTELVKA